VDLTLLLALTVPLALLAVLAVWVVRTYNRLVSVRNRSQEAWSGIDVQLQRRADLVPNLVATVEGYRFHEREVLERVTEARARMMRAEGPQASGEADDLLEAALTRLFAVAEGYPELRASGNFLALQRELAGLEEEISFARRYYNALAERMNTAVESFPTVLIAGPLGFHRVEYFKAGPEAMVVPETDLAT
jgi:LemA protein